MSPDAAVTQLDGDAAANQQEPPSANCHSLLPQFPMLPQQPALGTAFLIGLLQAMADKGMMGMERIALCEDDYGEGTEMIAATATNVISGGSNGTLSGAAASENAMVAHGLHHAAASCTCTVHVRPSRTLMSHGLLGPAVPLLHAQPVLCSLAGDRNGSSLVMPASSSERPACSPASVHVPLRDNGSLVTLPAPLSERPAAGPPAASEPDPLRSGGHVPSELLSELLPFHIAVDSDGRIVQVCQHARPP